MAVKPFNSMFTVATAGTKVQVTSANVYATSLYIEAAAGNTGAVYVGTSTVSSLAYISALSPGNGINISIESSPVRASGPGGGPEINLSSIYLDAATSGNIAAFTYLVRTDSN